jgi:hypothetical protein
MKKACILMMSVLLAMALAGCADPRNGSARGERASEQEGVDDNEVVIGGFAVQGPNGEISIPEVRTTREVVENYVQRARPIVEDEPLYVSRYVNPEVALQDRTLTLSVEAAAPEDARAEVAETLEELRRLSPPEGMEPVNQLLVASHVQALTAYDKVIEAFGSGDAQALADAVRENLPEIEQFAAGTNAIFQELERVETVDPNDRVETRG